MIVTPILKIHGLVFEKVVALKGPVVKNMVYCCLARSVHARFL